MIRSRTNPSYRENVENPPSACGLIPEAARAAMVAAFNTRNLTKSDTPFRRIDFL